jgi:hypothetical protein
MGLLCAFVGQLGNAPLALVIHGAINAVPFVSLLRYQNQGFHDLSFPGF